MEKHNKTNSKTHCPTNNGYLLYLTKCSKYTIKELYNKTRQTKE